MRTFDVILAICICAAAPGLGLAQGEQDDLLAQASVAVMQKDISKLEDILGEPGLDVSAQVGGEHTLLHLAANQGDAAAVRVLLDAGAEIDALEQAYGWTPLMLAVYQGHREAAETLLARGANREIVGTDRSTAPTLAHFSGLQDIFQTEEDAPRDQASLDRLLLMAAEAGDIDLVRTLLDEGANPLVISDSGWTPIHHAAYRRDIDLFNVITSISRGNSPSDLLPGVALTVPQAALMGAAASPTETDKTVSFLRSINDEYYGQKGEVSNYDFADRLGLPEKILGLLEDTIIKLPQLAGIAEEVDRETLSAPNSFSAPEATPDPAKKPFLANQMTLDRISKTGGLGWIRLARVDTQGSWEELALGDAYTEESIIRIISDHGRDVLDRGQWDSPEEMDTLRAEIAIAPTSWTISKDVMFFDDAEEALRRIQPQGDLKAGKKIVIRNVMLAPLLSGSFEVIALVAEELDSIENGRRPNIHIQKVIPLSERPQGAEL